jgi:hypothetical protein
MPDTVVRYTVVTLSFCVFFLALGIPTTLLSVCLPTDLLTASILEGLSLPPSVCHVDQFTTVRLPLEGTIVIEPAIFESFLFHPPIS